MATAAPPAKTLADEPRKAILQFHPCWCRLTNTRVRFVRFVTETAVEVADNDGKTLPDWRHPSQLEPY